MCKNIADSCDCHCHMGLGPDGILDALDTLARQAAAYTAGQSVDPRDLLWEILADVMTSWELALDGANVKWDVIERAHDTVMDYLANHYGDN